MIYHRVAQDINHVITIFLFITNGNVLVNFRNLLFTLSFLEFFGFLYQLGNLLLKVPLEDWAITFEL